MNKLLLTLLLVLPALASAEVRVFSCEPEWAAVAEEIGGDLVDTHAATTPFQDPHYIQARPSLIAKVRQADLVVCSGAQLEIGWLPALLQKANNRKVMPGNNGYLEASSLVVRLDATGDVDRAQGDIHPLGNPHIQTDPHNILAVAREIAARLAEIDQDNSDTYERNLESFVNEWTGAIERWEQRAEPLRGKRIITHHKSWVYLERWLQLDEVANLEAIPGLPPTATHLSRLTARFADGGADVIIRSPYQDGKPSEWLAERTGIPDIVLPLTVGGTEAATNLYAWFDDLIERLLEATDGV
jgi:zinc/manganese transport system substrate-binding protein